MEIPKIIIPDNLAEIKGNVFKLYYGEKYIVIMGKTLLRQVETIRNDLNRYFKETKLGRTPNNLYFKFYDFIYNTPGLNFNFELILQSEKPYQLLKCCQSELDKGNKDDNCMNMVFEPYINKELQKPLKSRKFIWWINRGEYLNFRKWQKQRVIS